MGMLCFVDEVAMKRLNVESLELQYRLHDVADAVAVVMDKRLT